MSVNIKDSSRPNDLNPVSGRVPDNVYKYDDALSLEEISASTDLTNKIPTAEAVGQINTNLFGEGDIGMSLYDMVKSLYDNSVPKTITSGESILSILLHGLNLKGQYENHCTFSHLDFTNIKEFTWNTSASTSISARKFIIYNESGSSLYSATSSSGSCDCESTAIDKLQTAKLYLYGKNGDGIANITFYITSYTTKDGVIHTAE